MMRELWCWLNGGHNYVKDFTRSHKMEGGGTYYSHWWLCTKCLYNKNTEEYRHGKT